MIITEIMTLYQECKDNARHVSRCRCPSSGTKRRRLEIRLLPLDHHTLSLKQHKSPAFSDNYLKCLSIILSSALYFSVIILNRSHNYNIKDIGKSLVNESFVVVGEKKKKL